MLKFVAKIGEQKRVEENSRSASDGLSEESSQSSTSQQLLPHDTHIEREDNRASTTHNNDWLNSAEALNQLFDAARRRCEHMQSADVLLASLDLTRNILVDAVKEPVKPVDTAAVTRLERAVLGQSNAATWEQFAPRYIRECVSLRKSVEHNFSLTSSLEQPTGKASNGGVQPAPATTVEGDGTSDDKNDAPSLDQLQTWLAAVPFSLKNLDNMREQIGELTRSKDQLVRAESTARQEVEF